MNLDIDEAISILIFGCNGVIERNLPPRPPPNPRPPPPPLPLPRPPLNSNHNANKHINLVKYFEFNFSFKQSPITLTHLIAVISNQKKYKMIHKKMCFYFQLTWFTHFVFSFLNYSQIEVNCKNSHKCVQQIVYQFVSLYFKI